jgi:2-keto-4-pentenoate hydratase/2-oxohepta-3-ene-1,7-dioic acid hydratase in catechol pathway
MKLVLFNDYRLGVLKGERVVDAMAALRGFRFHHPQEIMETVITRWEELRPRIERAVEGKEGVPVEGVRLRPPLPRPGQIICAARNYLEFGQRPPAELDAFIKSSTCVIGPGDTIHLPPANATVFHHEAELAFVIGKRATKIDKASAMDYIFGYVNFIDVSARGFMPEGRPSFYLMKSWDTFGPMGPALVTKDEIPDPHNLQVRLWVNEELRQDYPTSDMAHKIPEFLEFCSSVTTLLPGDVVATGTNHQGIGALQDGDVVRMEIEGLGTLVVKVEDPLKRSWPRGIDREFAQRVLRPTR